jgi:integrase
VYKDSNLEIFTTKGAGLGVSAFLTHRVFDEDGTYHTFYLIKNPLDGLRLPLDKCARQPKSTITPEQFHALLALVPEPYASMPFLGVWSGLRVSELIGL